VINKNFLFCDQEFVKLIIFVLPLAYTCLALTGCALEMQPIELSPPNLSNDNTKGASCTKGEKVNQYCTAQAYTETLSIEIHGEIKNLSNGAMKITRIFSWSLWRWWV
jgi:hypothetical protein